MITKARTLAFIALVGALLAGVLLAIGNPFDSKPKTYSSLLAAPNTKAGAEQLVLANATTFLSAEIRPKFVDLTTGLLQNNDYAQCYPSTTTNGWWVCELNSAEHPRPQVWFSVSYTGTIRKKGEQPLGYGWVPTPVLSAEKPKTAPPSTSGVQQPTLPVTGISLWLIATLAGLVLVFGLILRESAKRERNSSERSSRN